MCLVRAQIFGPDSGPEGGGGVILGALVLRMPGLTAASKDQRISFGLVAGQDLSIRHYWEQPM